MGGTLADLRCGRADAGTRRPVDGCSPPAGTPALGHVGRIVNHRGLGLLITAWLGVMVICSAGLYLAENGINKAISSPLTPCGGASSPSRRSGTATSTQRPPRVAAVLAIALVVSAVSACSTPTPTPALTASPEVIPSAPPTGGNGWTLLRTVVPTAVNEGLAIASLGPDQWVLSITVDDGGSDGCNKATVVGFRRSRTTVVAEIERSAVQPNEICATASAVTFYVALDRTIVTPAILQVALSDTCANLVCSVPALWLQARPIVVSTFERRQSWAWRRIAKPTLGSTCCRTHPTMSGPRSPAARPLGLVPECWPRRAM